MSNEKRFYFSQILNQNSIHVPFRTYNESISIQIRWRFLRFNLINCDSKMFWGQKRKEENVNWTNKWRHKGNNKHRISELELNVILLWKIFEVANTLVEQKHGKHYLFFVLSWKEININKVVPKSTRNFNRLLQSNLIFELLDDREQRKSSGKR